VASDDEEGESDGNPVESPISSESVAVGADDSLPVKQTTPEKQADNEPATAPSSNTDDAVEASIVSIDPTTASPVVISAKNKLDKGVISQSEFEQVLKTDAAATAASSTVENENARNTTQGSLVVSSAVASAQSKLDRGLISKEEFDVIVSTTEKMAGNFSSTPVLNASSSEGTGGVSPSSLQLPAAAPEEPPMFPSAISFPDVVIKYRFSSNRRLVTIQLDEMRLLQQVSATKTKGNDCSEVSAIAPERKNSLSLFVAGVSATFATQHRSTSTASNGRKVLEMAR
jgi:PHD/YefM family antitoxin component YafN of YafNO toxin-antitoxin module